jgi:diguanylate cyclase (GGDEF)-like protein
MDILIAEDDRASALALQRALERMGYAVSVVRNGVEAWERICAGGIGLLVSDWMMPELDGLELCRRIRGRSDSVYTYVILLTGRRSRSDRIAGLQAGADDFLTKPFDASELIARLNVARRILTMQDQLRAHAAQLAELKAILERQNAQLAQRAATDGLTGLSNRRKFDEALDSALSFAERQSHSVSLVLLDVDHFKAYNDQFGHLAGDDVLRALADHLRFAAREHDVVARYGGEEFALILPATDAAGSRAVAERIREAIIRHPWPARPVTASLGVATAPPVASSAAHLVKSADQALYASKARGRDKVTHHLDVFPETALNSATVGSPSSVPALHSARAESNGSREHASG